MVHSEVVEARERDHADQQQFQRRFRQLISTISALPERADAEQLLELLPQLEQCYDECRMLCIDLPQEQQALQRLLQLFERALLDANQNDADFLQRQQLEQQARRHHQQLLESPLVATMMRDPSPIPMDHLAPTLLSSTVAEVKPLLQVLQPEQLLSLQQQCDALLQQTIPSPPSVANDIVAEIQQAMTSAQDRAK